MHCKRPAIVSEHEINAETYLAELRREAGDLALALYEPPTAANRSENVLRFARAPSNFAPHPS